jgi:hypothetical protein
LGQEVPDRLLAGEFLPFFILMRKKVNKKMRIFFKESAMREGFKGAREKLKHCLGLKFREKVYPLCSEGYRIGFLAPFEQQIGGGTKGDDKGS